MNLKEDKAVHTPVGNGHPVRYHKASQTEIPFRKGGSLLVVETKQAQNSLAKNSKSPLIAKKGLYLFGRGLNPRPIQVLT